MASLAFLSLLFLSVSPPLPLWELHTEAPPRGGAHLIDAGGSSEILLIPMGDAGLGAWRSGGTPVPGFPVSAGEGVILRPAAVPGSTGETLIAYADNDGYTHLVDLGGNEIHGWPVYNTANVITSVTSLDLNKDGVYEIAYGTSDGLVHLLDTRGVELPGFPVDLQSQLQFQPTQVSLGGGFANGLVCSTNNSKITVLGSDGVPRPGWPVQTRFPAGTVPVSGDVNGDGQADIVFATQDGRVHLFSLLGAEQEGWPFYMDARPVSGSCALGLLDVEQQLPQIAVASIDSVVYLLNGDGSLAGTWRWPNHTDSKPFQPIVFYTGTGPSVIVSSTSGSIYAWGASGRRSAGFPFTNPGGAIFTPVVGDLDGDGSDELIVTNPTGTVLAYPLVSHASSQSMWPLPLGNQNNSGSYGTEFLPVASVEQLSGEFSGPVSLNFSVDGTYTGISVSFSPDAGYTWQETRNFTERPGAITWDSEKDIPSQDIPRCLVRITPYCNFGPGESGISGLLHIDNNRPPQVLMDDPEKIDDARFRFGYAIEDPEGDTVQLQSQYSVDGGNTWNTMHLSGNSIEIEPWFYGEPVTWNAVTDLGHVDIDSVSMRIRAADADPGPWYYLHGLHIDTDRLPSAQIIAPTTEAQGRVVLGVRLSDPDRNLLDVQYQYSTDGGETWHPATVVEAAQAGIARYDFEVTWESDKDLPGYDGYRVRFQALPADNNVGIAVPSAPFHLDNNAQPSVRILSPSVYDICEGLVPVSFSLSDAEGDDITLNLEYKLHGVSDDTWHTANGLVSKGPFGPSRYRSTLNWNSSVDLPELTGRDIDIRLVASDGDTVRSEVLGPLTMNNKNIPELIRATIADADESAGRVEIAFELADNESRVMDLDIDYSLDHGETWRQATVTGSTTRLNSYLYSNSFTWYYRDDTMGSRGTTILRITPVYENGLLGRPRLIEQVFR